MAGREIQKNSQGCQDKAQRLTRLCLRLHPGGNLSQHYHLIQVERMSSAGKPGGTASHLTLLAVAEAEESPDLVFRLIGQRTKMFLLVDGHVEVPNYLTYCLPQLNNFTFSLSLHSFSSLLSHQQLQFCSLYCSVYTNILIYRSLIFQGNYEDNQLQLLEDIRSRGQGQ